MSQPLAEPGTGITTSWTLGDVIDYEHAVTQALNTADGEQSLQAAGRELSKLFSTSDLGEIPRRKLFRTWLNLTRSQNQLLHGQSIDNAVWAVKNCTWLLGCFLGAIAAAGYLAYNGAKPINVMWFAFWLIVFPWAITLGGFAVSAGIRGRSTPGLLGSVIATLLSKLSPDWRESWEHLSGVVHQHAARVAPIGRWVISRFSQQFACSFGVGALLALLLHVLAVDLAFGWESTLNVGDEIIHATTKAVAKPWTWLFPHGSPTLQEIRDSRFTHLTGVEPAAVNATRSWWPFLAGCLAFYVVILRFLVINFMSWRQARALATLDFHRTKDSALLRRLNGPLFQTETSGGDGALDDATPKAFVSPTNTSWILLTTDGLDLTEQAVANACASNLQGKISACLSIELDYADGNQPALETLRSIHDSIVVAIPGHLDPIDAIATTLRTFVEACPANDRVIALFGNDQRLDLWRRWVHRKQLEFDLIRISDL